MSLELFSSRYPGGASFLIMSNGDETIKEYKLRPDTIIIAGSAKLPDGTTAKHAFGSVTIELEVDPVDTKIVDVSCTLLPLLGEKLIHTVLLGSKVDEGIRDAIEQLKKRFFSPTKRAVIAALEDVYNKWCNLPAKEMPLKPAADEVIIFREKGED